MRLLALALVALGACTLPPDALVVRVGEDSALRLDLAVDGEREVVLDTGNESLLIELAIDGDETVETTSLSGAERFASPHWFRPQPTTGRVAIAFAGVGSVTVRIWSRGTVLDPVDPERAVVWHETVPLDDPSVISFASVVAAMSADGHGGAVLERWFERFATTAYSQRPGPAALLIPLRQTFGDDPSGWDLNALPFSITAVHNRVDLYATEGNCGQVRVTATATPTASSVLHLIFLFRQLPRDDDIAPDGTVHCLGTARFWSRFSRLAAGDFAARAREWLGEALASDRFALAESLELDDGVWEWRQWSPEGSVEPMVLENPPLFQTVDVDRVNAPGAIRDEFLELVEANAEALDDRTILVPERFRSRFAQLTVGQPRPALDLTGVEPSVLSQFPRLAEEIEIVGCPTCHTTPAPEFNHTYPQRIFSDFQFDEIQARAQLLDDMNAGREVAPPPFGPLQAY